MSSSLIQSWLEPFNHQQLRDKFFRVIQVIAALVLFSPYSHFRWHAENGGEGVEQRGLGILGEPWIVMQRDCVGYISELQYSAPVFTFAPTFWYVVATVLLILLSLKMPKA